MMKRLFWLVLGAVLGVVAFRKLSRKAEAFTPSGVASSIGSLAESVRDFADDIREAMSQREHELREGTGLDGTLGARPEDFE
jgi:F0F1-type ATP synthase membrane subunit a